MDLSNLTIPELEDLIREAKTRLVALRASQNPSPSFGLAYNLDLLNVSETAVILGISSRTIARMIRQNALPVVRVGRRVFIHKTRLYRMLDAKTENRKAPNTQG